MIQAHSKMRGALGREFPIVKLFEFPTVRLIAERLSREAGQSPAQSENAERARRRTRGR
jgi:hypothetical protein